MLANTVGTLAEASAAQGQPESAADHYDKALSLLEQFPDNAWANKLQEDFSCQKKMLIATSVN